MEVYVDQALQTSWTSSGTTTEFETVELGVTGQTVELRGVLADSEWLSIMEVRTGVSGNLRNNETPGVENNSTRSSRTHTPALFRQSTMRGTR